MFLMKAFTFLDKQESMEIDNDEVNDENIVTEEVIDDNEVEDDESLMTSELTFTSENLQGATLTVDNSDGFEEIKDFEIDVEIFEGKG